MKDKYQIILSGVGGQGLVSAGTLIAKTAIEKEQKNATFTSAYGSEMRGTFTKSEIIISSSEIYYPEVLKPDVILAMAPIAYNKYINELNEDILLIYDNYLVKDLKESNIKQYGYNFTELASSMGHIMIANIIAIGVLVKLLGLLKEENVIDTIKKTFANNIIAEKNIAAFRKGLEMA